MAITGGEAIVKSLAAHGVRTVFGIPGTHNLAVYDALLDSDIQHVLTRHEQGAAFMADGYARAAGRPGVCITTTGPAVMNALAALSTAYSDSSPILVIASQISAEHLGQGKGYGHESPDQLSGFRPVTKWSRRCDTVSVIPEAVREAFLEMKSGRPRPTVLEIPFDVLDGSGEVGIPEPAPIETPEPDENALDRAADLLKKAKRSVIWGRRRCGCEWRIVGAAQLGRDARGACLSHDAGQGIPTGRSPSSGGEHAHASACHRVPFELRPDARHRNPFP